MHAGVLRDIALEEAEIQLKKEAARAEKGAADVDPSRTSSAPLTAAPPAVTDTARAAPQPASRPHAAPLPAAAGMHTGAGAIGGRASAGPEMVCEGDVCRLAVRRQTPVVPLR
jgi:hypothetical protein